MSYSSEIKASIIKRTKELDLKALVCVFNYFSNDGVILTTNSKLARFIRLNVDGAYSRIKKGVKRSTHLYEITLNVDDCKSLSEKEVVIGAFLVCGSVSTPKKSYNLEFVLNTKAKSDYLYKVLEEAGLKFNRTMRNKRHIVYTKSSETITYFMYYIGENIRATDLENISILRGIKSRVNRRVNFEIHNEELKLSASDRQIHMINEIAKKIGLSNIDPSLAEVATLRLDNPDKSLSELAKLSSSDITKSGINSRLKRIEKLYNSLGD